MKIQKTEIAAKLNAMRGIVSSKSAVDALKGVLFRDNTLTAYNLEVGVTATVDTHTDEAFIIPARAVDMIESLPDGFIEITANDKSMVTIKMDGILHKAQSFPVADFPDLPEIVEGKNATLPFELLQKAVNSVLYAVSVSENNPIQTGVLFHAADGFLDLVACDGYRIAWQKLAYDGTFDFVVPKAAVQKIIGIGMEGDLRITYGRRTAQFSAGGYAVFVRLLEGRFIDYHAAIPQYTNSAAIDRKKLLACLQRVLICQDAVTKPVLSFSTNSVELSIRGAISEYSESVALTQPLAESVHIGFNGKYLMECLKTCESESVQFSLGGNLKPIVIHDGSLTALLLPVRLKE